MPMRRRDAIVAIAGAAGARSLAARVAPPALHTMGVPEAMAQIAAGGPTGLLAVARSGKLFSLPLTLLPVTPDGSGLQLLADGIDPATPLASGHGRIAARRRDGALWVLDQDARPALSKERTLAPAAGLLVLPLAVIGIEADGNRHRVVRLEPAGSDGSWRRVARSAVEVLPDARPIQADLDGAGDGGHVVVLAGPDAERYRHGVLGDAIEATRIVVLERHGLDVMREAVIDAPHVLEDIAPRRVRHGTREGLLTVRSGPQGAQLVLIESHPSEARSLRVAARGPSLGVVNRWLSPTTDGMHWLAVHTPHIGGVLHAYRRDGDRLLAHKITDGVSNHRIGSRELDLSAWQGQRLFIPDQARRRMFVLDGQLGWQRIHEWDLPAPVIATAALGSNGGVAILHEDGSVSRARLPN